MDSSAALHDDYARQLAVAESLGRKLAVDNERLQRELREKERVVSQQIASLLGKGGALPADAQLLAKVVALQEEKAALQGELDELKQQVVECETLEARNDALEKKVASLSTWADTAAEKLKKDHQIRTDVEAENESLRQRVMVLTEATERLRTRIALLEENSSSASPASGSESSTTPSALHKRLQQLEDTLSSARESLKRKGDREKLLLSERAGLQSSVATLTDNLRLLKMENQEVQEKLALALSGITAVDGLMATMAKSYATPQFDLRRGDVVTVLAAEGEWARVSHDGQSGRVPVTSLACAGIPILQYLDLVIPDRKAMDKMMDEWIARVLVVPANGGADNSFSEDDDSSTYADAPLLGSRSARASPMRSTPTAAEVEAGVRSIRNKVETMLTDLDESFSEASSPMTSAATTPRGKVFAPFPVSDSLLMQALLTSVDELSAAARDYNKLFASLQKEASPLLQQTSGSALEERVAYAASVERALETERAEVARLRAETRRLEGDLAAAVQSASRALENAALAEARALAAPASSTMASAASSSSGSTTRDANATQNMADALQAQLDLQEARAERDQYKLEAESLRAASASSVAAAAATSNPKDKEKIAFLEAELKRLASAQQSLVKERERCATLEEKIVQQGRKLDAQSMLAKELAEERKRADAAEKRLEAKTEALIAERERTTMLQEELATERSRHDSPTMSKRVSIKGLLKKKDSPLSTSSSSLSRASSGGAIAGSGNVSAAANTSGPIAVAAAPRSTPVSIRAANSQALTEARRELEVVEGRLRTSPRATNASVGELESERERLVTEIAALESMLMRNASSDNLMPASPTAVAPDPNVSRSLYEAATHGSTRGGLNDLSVDTTGLDSILQDQISATELAETEVLRRASVLRSIPGIKVVDTDALRTRLAAAEEHNAQLGAQLEAARAQQQRDAEEARRTEAELKALRKQADEHAQAERERRRDESEAVRTLQFQLKEMQDRYTEEKEHRARMIEHEEAQKMSQRAEVATLKRQLHDAQQQQGGTTNANAVAAPAVAENSASRGAVVAELEQQLAAAHAAAQLLREANSEISKKLATVRENNRQLEAQLAAAGELHASQITMERERAKAEFAAALETQHALQRELTQQQERVRLDLAAAHENVKMLEAQLMAAGEAHASAVTFERERARHELAAAVEAQHALERTLKTQQERAQADLAAALEAQHALERSRRADKERARAELAEAVEAQRVAEGALSEERDRAKRESAARIKLEQDMEAATVARTKLEQDVATATATRVKLEQALLAEQQRRQTEARAQQQQERSAQADASAQLEARLLEATRTLSQLRESNKELEARVKVTEAELNGAREREAALDSRLMGALRTVAEVEERARQADQIEARLLEATRTISQLRDANKQVEAAGAAKLTEVRKEADDVRAKLLKMQAVVKDLMARHNALVQDHQREEARANSQTQLVVRLQQELMTMAGRFEALERMSVQSPARQAAAPAASAQSTPVKTPMGRRVGAATEDDETLQQLARLATAVSGSPDAASSPAAASSEIARLKQLLSDAESRAKIAEQAVANVAASGAGGAAVLVEADVLRRQAQLDAREARVQAREELLSLLQEARAEKAQADQAEQSERRLRREAELELSGCRTLLESKEGERAEASAKVKALETLTAKQQQETRQMVDVMHTQVSLLQAEKTELRKQLESKGRDKETASVQSLELRLQLMAKQHQQAELDHQQQFKFVSDELASQQRLSQTYAEVNATLKASTDLLRGEVDQLRRNLKRESAQVDTLHRERDSHRDEAQRAIIERNMFERISAKLQKRIGDEEAPDDEGRSKVELELREHVRALKEQVEHESQRKHQLFEKVEAMQSEIAELRNGGKK